MDYYFRVCVQDCVESPLPRGEEYYDLFLERVMQWDTLSECEYSCMRSISDVRAERGYNMLKYFGHWPYFRVFGLQEPASCVFSLCNAIPHIYHLMCSHHLFHNELRLWIVSYGVTAIFAWCCSTAFHARKISPTILLDYTSALLFLVFGLYVALRRTLHFSVFRCRPFLSISLIGIMSSACLRRIYDMYQGQVSFDSHMTLSIGIAIMHTSVWILWLLLSSRESKSHKLQCLYLQLWFIAASMLELFDFPPILQHFDAHSLWHFATIPLGHLWYEFWIQDAIVMNKLEADIHSKCDKES